MPLLTVNTNVSADQVPADFKAQATDAVAKSLGKPAAYIAVQVNAGQDLSFAGTNEPSAMCDLVSIGALSVESNKKHSKVLMALLEKSLKISPSRCYIIFRNVNKSDVGFQGTTFDDLM